uniref:Rieske domain-containing protein n=1 Tax=Aureoumbra lagunensis TaxID=44058 RepID=A0A7S3NHL0_9STRA
MSFLKTQKYSAFVSLIAIVQALQSGRIFREDKFRRTQLRLAAVNGEPLPEYCKSWFPIGLSSEEIDRPLSVTVLKKKLVLWKSVDGWKCADDVCPHRAAALSAGKINKDGDLTCRFHGWSFNAHGACSKCPNALDTLPKIGLSRMYEVREEAGLIFVWMGDKQFDASTDPPIPVPSGNFTNDTSWLVTIPGVSWESMIENSLDPTHAPQLHEGTFFSADAIPMKNFEIESSNTAGLKLTHSGYSTKNKDMNATRTFVAPCLVDVCYEFSNGKKQQFPLYFVPRTESTTTVFAGGLAFLPRTSIISRFFSDLAHIFFFTRESLWIFNYQDTQIMIGQDQRRNNFKQAAFSPTATSPSDVGVAALQSWLNTYGRPFSGVVSSSPSHSSSRWNIHGRHCSICTRGLLRINALQKQTSRVSFLAAALSISTLFLFQLDRLRLFAGLALFALLTSGFSSFLLKTRKAFLKGNKPTHDLWIRSDVFPTAAL